MALQIDPPSSKADVIPPCLRRIVGLPFRGGVHRVSAVALVLLLAGCASVRFDAPRVPSHAFDQPLLTPLGQVYLPQLDAGRDQGRSGFHLLVSGREAFAARAALAESTLRSLDLQYYSVDPGSTSTLLLEAALRAAQRGVRVRLLVDDLNVGEHEADLAMLAGHPNVEVRLFNPFSQRGGLGLAQVLELIGDSDRLNRRMHNKLWIADGAVAVMGGRNLGDTYFDASGEADFADLDVLAAGPVVGDVSRSFDQYWNSEWAVPIAAIAGPARSAADLQRAWSALADRAELVRQSDYVRALRATAFGLLVRNGEVPLVVAPAEVLFDPPGDPHAGDGGKKGVIFPALRQVVERARHEVVMVTPYLVPSGRGVDALCGLTGRGVRVRILTNSLASTDVTVVHAGYARYRPRMLACGVQLHELRPKGLRAEGRRVGLAAGVSLHTKAIVVDGESVFVGSMNLDPRSRALNSEVALKIDSRRLGMQLRGLFDEATALEESFRVGLDKPGDAEAPLHWDGIEDGRPIRYIHEPLTSAWRRWSTHLLGVLAPEELL